MGLALARLYVFGTIWTHCPTRGLAPNGGKPVVAIPGPAHLGVETHERIMNLLPYERHWGRLPCAGTTNVQSSNGYDTIEDMRETCTVR